MEPLHLHPWIARPGFSRTMDFPIISAAFVSPSTASTIAISRPLANSMLTLYTYRVIPLNTTDCFIYRVILLNTTDYDGLWTFKTQTCKLGKANLPAQTEKTAWPIVTGTIWILKNLTSLRKFVAIWTSPTSPKPCGKVCCLFSLQTPWYLCSHQE